MKTLKDLRERLDLKQNEVAKALNMNPSTYSNYENDIREPDIETLNKIAEFFGVSIDYLTNRENRIKHITIKLTNEEYHMFEDILERIKTSIKLKQKKKD